MARSSPFGEEAPRLRLWEYLLQIVVAHSVRGFTRVRPGLHETVVTVLTTAVIVYALSAIVSGDIQCHLRFRCGVP